MSQMKDLPSDANLGHVFQCFPKGVDHLLKYHDTVLPGPSEFTIGERELIAACVSSLNSCYYYAGAHSVIAETFGIEVETLQMLIENPDTDTFSSKLSPILNYVRKLTLNPSKMFPEDVEAVRTVGWSKDALFEAISVCTLFKLHAPYSRRLWIKHEHGSANRNSRTPPQRQKRYPLHGLRETLGNY